MFWRPLREADLVDCLDLQPACLGDQIVGRATALRVWKSLLENPGFQGTIIESEVPIAGSKLAGCGMGVFVSRSFADHEIANPRPGINSRIISSVAKRQPVVLSRAGIAAANAGEGLDFVNLYGIWRHGILNPERVAEVQALLGTSFIEHFAGYRFHRVLKEAIGAAAISFARATGTYRLVGEFSESQSALAVLTPESARGAPYSVAAALYRYRPPVLRLRPAEQQLLIAALSGKTDAELSSVLGLSIEATKKRWLSVFARIDQFRPEILDQPGTELSRRGPQKRHRVLAYIRSHPEELRPFAWDAKKP